MSTTVAYVIVMMWVYGAIAASTGVTRLALRAKLGDGQAFMCGVLTLALWFGLSLGGIQLGSTSG